MSAGYTEFIEGFPTDRRAPGVRHEEVCCRLHAAVAVALGGMTICKLLAVRDEVTLDDGSRIRPDLAVVTVATGKAFIVAEVIQAGDHSNDTVVKKQLFESARVPRLWMVDPRYDNVEVYHGTPDGLILRSILAGREELTDPLLPQLRCVVDRLFGNVV